MCPVSAEASANVRQDVCLNMWLTVTCVTICNMCSICKM